MNWMELLISWSLTLLVALTPLSIDAAEVDPLPQLFDRALALSRAGDLRATRFSGLPQARDCEATSFARYI